MPAKANRSTLALTIVNAALLAGILATLHLTSAPAAHASARADADADADGQVAVCSLINIINDLMNSDRFRPARLDLEQEIRDNEIGPLIQDGMALETELNGIADKESPEAKDLQRRILAIRENLTQKNLQARQRLAEFELQQAYEAFELARTSARAVAQDLGFDYLLSSVPADQPLTPGPMQVFHSDVMSRTVLMAPDGVDISDEVRDDLKLD